MCGCATHNLRAIPRRWPLRKKGSQGALLDLSLLRRVQQSSFAILRGLDCSLLSSSACVTSIGLPLGRTQSSCCHVLGMQLHRVMHRTSPVVQDLPQDTPSNSSTPFQEFDGNLRVQAVLLCHLSISHHCQSTLVLHMCNGEPHGRVIPLPVNRCFDAKNLMS